MVNHLKKKKAAVVATGWVGDTIACTAAATSLYELGYEVTFFTRWPQLVEMLRNDSRFSVRLNRYLKLMRLLKPILSWYFDLVVWEPKKWSYKEPFTAEIRRIAGCHPTPEYELFLGFKKVMTEISHGSRPVIAVSRDLYKRAYGRGVDDLIAQLQTLGRIEWVGLPPDKNSRHGKRKSLLYDAARISESDIFMGPEGGLLWLAAGIGKPCVYFTENIIEVAKQNNFFNLDHVLGSKNCFPESPIHFALPPYCSNERVIKVARDVIHELGLRYDKQ